MYILKFICFGIFLLLANVDSNTSLAATTIRLCGKSLTDFLKDMCSDGYNQLNLLKKKSGINIYFIL